MQASWPCRNASLHTKHAFTRRCRASQDSELHARMLHSVADHPNNNKGRTAEWTVCSSMNASLASLSRPSASSPRDLDKVSGAPGCPPRSSAAATVAASASAVRARCRRSCLHARAFLADSLRVMPPRWRPTWLSRGANRASIGMAGKALLEPRINVQCGTLQKSASKQPATETRTVSGT